MIRSYGLSCITLLLVSACATGRTESNGASPTPIPDASAEAARIEVDNPTAALLTVSLAQEGGDEPKVASLGTVPPNRLQMFGFDGPAGRYRLIAIIQESRPVRNPPDPRGRSRTERLESPVFELNQTSIIAWDWRYNRIIERR